MSDLQRPPQSVKQLLASRDGALAPLVQQNAQRLRLNALLDEFLDRPFRDHVQVARCHDHELILCADSPIWGHRVRYLSPAILDHFVTHGLSNLKCVRIIVRPMAPPSPPAHPSSAPSVSANTAQHLRQAAESMGDEAIAAPLRRISRQLAKGSVR